MRSRSAVLLTATLVALATCRRAEDAGPAQIRRFPLKGTVREVDPGKAEITVEHEAVPDFMGAMTMSFPVRGDRALLPALKPGDSIQATLVVEGDRYWLENLARGEPLVTAARATPEPNRGVAPGDSVPDFALTDQTGKTVRLSDFRGEPVAVTFLYTRCPIATACPLTTAKFSRLDAMLKGKPGKLLVITVEPEHDTPGILGEYAKKAGADPKRWKFLTGTPKDVAEAATSFGVVYYPDRGQIIHSQAVAVVDPKGHLATIYYGERWEPEHLLRDMEEARRRG